jgi:hypothetical protein
MRMAPNVEDQALMQLLLARADLIRLHDFLVKRLRPSRILIWPPG